MPSIGEPDANAFAAEILKLLGDVAGLSQCTVFAYAFGNRPRTLSVADHRGGRYLRDVADTNASRFHAPDGNQRIMATAWPRGCPSDNGLMLHQQTIDEIAHKAYRAACYRHPNVSDRQPLLVPPAEDMWLSVNLYRDRSRGLF